ncbi:MAG: sulfatase-like hydrolase/transferase [Verrucomicrobia bacterium]|nr:sulfatase-like hydrolase/transferase [Verrucomicrobiota bacterium]
MRRGTIIAAWLTFALVFAASPSLCAADASVTRPNVLFILVDDMGWGDLGANGGAGVPTPRMDRLAHEGTRFTQFYTASPICSPSRCGFITGQFPARWRITSYLQSRAGNRECGQADFLDPKAPSLVRAFKAAGYATAHVGKWHLGGGRDVTDAPKFAAYGYDVGLGTYESPEPAAALGLKRMPWSKETEPQQVKRHDRTRWMVDETLAFVKKHAAQPWLVNLWLDDVHTPYAPSDEQKVAAGEGVGTAEYRAVLRETDRQIGRLLDGLRDLKLGGNTLVLLAGDNGPQPSFDRKRTAGLRGMKWSLYEGGIRTPLIVRWPGVVPAGAVNSSTVVSAVDFFPTLCSLASVPAPDGARFDGEDLSAVFRGGKQPRTEPLFWEYGRKPAPKGKKGLRAFPYPSEPESKSPNVALRDGRWKLLVNADGSCVELYNLDADPKETKNLAEAKPDIARRLSEQALAWRKSLP